jgi:DNA polymerase delta subunit 4
MPATRRTRSSTGPATKGAQSTLSFGNRSRVTKAVPPSSKLSKDVTKSIKAKISTPDPEPESTEIIPSKVDTPELGHITSEAAVEKQAKVELSKNEMEKSEEVRKAESISDAQMKRYWKAREAERKMHRGMF